MSIWNHSQNLREAISPEHRISLGEGNTPLIRSRRIGPALGLDHLFFKIETTNPTASYKDRFAAAAISNLLAKSTRLCLGTSSGNTGAALAAYSAAAGIPCCLAVVETTPTAKIDQMLAYGAHIFRLKGFGIDASHTEHVFGHLVGLAADLTIPLQISAYCYSPFGMEGVETIAQEIASAGISVDHVFCPSGGGGLALAVAKGFSRTNSAPAVHCVQPEGNDTIATPLRDGLLFARSCVCSTSISGLQVASVLDGTETLRACRETGGLGYAVADQNVYRLQRELATNEGIYCEPAGAVSLAGALKALKWGEIRTSDTVVCLVTGSGFKDSEYSTRYSNDGSRLIDGSSVKQIADYVRGHV